MDVPQLVDNFFLYLFLSCPIALAKTSIINIEYWWMDMLALFLDMPSVFPS